MWYEKDPVQQRRFLMVSMLYWDYREKGASQRLMLPIYYRWREDERSLLVSLPFVLSYARPQERWMVAGLFYRHADQKKTRTALFPLYWQKVRREGGRVTVAFPFLFYDYRSQHRDRVDQVSLAGWYRRRPERSRGMVLNWWWSREPEARFATLFPLAWHFWSPEDRLDALGLFYLRRRGPLAVAAAQPPSEALYLDPAPAGRRYAGFFPLAGAGWGKDYRSSYLFPLYYASRAPGQYRLLTLPFSRFRAGDDRRGHAGLYFYSHDPDLRLDGVFPVWHRRRSADGFEDSAQVLNFYRRRENEDVFQTLFPLYGYSSSPEGSRLVSWGVWSSRSGEARSGWAYLYHWKRTAEGDDTRVLFPLYWRLWRPPDWRLDVLFPFYTRYRDGAVTVTAVPPVIVRKSPDRTTWSVLFLYWRDRDLQRGSVTLLPFFHDAYDPRRRMFFSPLAWTRRSAASREGVVPPVYWYRSAEARRTVVFPLYWGSRAPDKSLTILPPYYRWRREDRLAYGLFPLWGRHHPLRAEGRPPNPAAERGGYLFPFYWYSVDGRGDGWWVLPPALTYVNRAGGGTENPRLGVQYLLLGSVQKSSRTLEHDFFPLYKYVRRDDFKNFWAPRGIALTAWESRPGFRKGYVFPYVWRRSLEKDWDLVLPLYYRSAEFAVEGSSEAVRRRGKSKASAAVLFPFYWSGANPERDYRYVVPFYAHYGEGPRRFTAAAPLWWSYDGATGRKFRLLFPLYWRFLMKGESAAEKDITVFGPWYRVNARRDGRSSRTAGFAPLFANTVAGEGDRYFEVLGGLFARDVQAGRRRFRFFYFFYTRPRPLPAEQRRF